MVLDLGINWIRFKDWPWQPEESLLFVLAILFSTCLFSYVAFTGKSPSLISRLEREYEEKLQLPPGRVTKLIRTFSFRLAAVSGLMFFLILGDSIDLFGDDIRGLVFLVEALCVLAVVALIWSNYCLNHHGAENKGGKDAT
jgi:hypothetical protein